MPVGIYSLLKARDMLDMLTLLDLIELDKGLEQSAQYPQT
jgi:hypothetical protein